MASVQTLFPPASQLHTTPPSDAAMFMTPHSGRNRRHLADDHAPDDRSFPRDRRDNRKRNRTRRGKPQVFSDWN